MNPKLILILITYLCLQILVINCLPSPAAKITHVESYMEIQPEFVGPIKNITSPIGTNVDFGCTVQHLGSSRIMWFRRQNSKKEELLGVNGLKISKSPKISLSLIPSSGIVTQSILYIYDIAPEDVGEYICGVNTNPVITQTGILEIKVEAQKPEQKKPKTTSPTPRLISENQHDFGITAIIIENNSSSDSDGIFCIDFPKIWKDSKQEARKYINIIWNKIHKYF